MIGGFGTSPIELMVTDAMLKGEVFCEPFIYNTSWITGTPSALPASAETDLQLQINSDSDFICQCVNIFAATALGTLLPSPDYLFNLVVAGSGRQMFNTQVPITNVAGNWQNGAVPGYWPLPKLLAANTTLTLQLNNRTAVAANRADVSLLGFKVFYTGGVRKQIFHTL